MNLNNRLVVITGSTGILGQAIAQKLGDLGASLALLGRNAGKLAQLTERLSLPKSRVISRTVELTNAEETKESADFIVERIGHVDALLHLVGGWTGGKLLTEASEENLAFMLDQHIWTSFHVIQAFIPHIVRNGWGRVIMVSSPYAARPTAKGGLYAAGKAGQEALMLSLSQELKGSGVTANTLLVKTIDVNHEKISSATAENQSWTTPEEIVSAILFLLSDEGKTVNGAKIPLFGSYA
jgi:NAD(P)-dependent dehydrogenase (short-subunit alcohol dehydrogenase family)